MNQLKPTPIPLARLRAIGEQLVDENLPGYSLASEPADPVPAPSVVPTKRGRPSKRSVKGRGQPSIRGSAKVGLASLLTSFGSVSNFSLAFEL